ncbi:GAF domain-containing sensor histidine kinase [Bradyrhizobium liaoningense]|uniref:GAF domain-containing sensor histidine kinase n=1 Tax=Bradyrhizobium liaoningense TaxID=43992 RepID=UPI001BAAD082|nr:GAF domain-containing sensor histidine kinase [Bradyrhizobium liaoningense]MBR0905539.1 GAF domain-containing sensor histidine kinase [Bradyrhizobium liaoningense]
MTTDVQADIDAIQRIGSVPKILDVVSRITGMGFVAIARVTSDQWVCCAVRDEINFGLEPGGELKVETTICKEIRGHGELVVFDDATDDLVFCNHPTPKMYGFRSYISAPIKTTDGSVWGTLCAIDPNPHELDKAEIVQTFTLFAELISAQLVLQGRFEVSQTQLGISEANRLSAEADLMDERKTSELREQFIGVLGHDLRNPLANIDAGMRFLLKNIGTDRAPEIITSVQKSVLRMAKLVDNVLDFARGRLGGGLTLQRDSSQPLKPTLEHVVSELQAAWPEAVIKTNFDIEDPVNCDRGKIGQLLSNLLGNAITYGDVGKPITVTAKTRGTVFELSVTNIGAPISEKAMANLFMPYTRGDRPSQQGLGLGLYIATQIARAHGGKLTVTSNSETKFVFEMPQADH